MSLNLLSQCRFTSFFDDMCKGSCISFSAMHAQKSENAFATAIHIHRSVHKLSYLNFNIHVNIHILLKDYNHFDILCSYVILKLEFKVASSSSLCNEKKM